MKMSDYVGKGLSTTGWLAYNVLKSGVGLAMASESGFEPILFFCFNLNPSNWV